jgi:hypothetical protein
LAIRAFWTNIAGNFALQTYNCYLAWTFVFRQTDPQSCLGGLLLVYFPLTFSALRFFFSQFFFSPKKSSCLSSRVFRLLFNHRLVEEKIEVEKWLMLDREQSQREPFTADVAHNQALSERRWFANHAWVIRDFTLLGLSTGISILLCLVSLCWFVFYYVNFAAPNRHVDRQWRCRDASE